MTIQSNAENDLGTFTEEVKRLLAEQKHFISLDNLMMREVRRFEGLTGQDLFRLDTAWRSEEFLDRVARYEAAAQRLLNATACIAYWGNTDQHRRLLSKVISHSMDRVKVSSGTTAWLYMSLYPSALLVYLGGIAAMSADNYGNMAAIVNAESPNADVPGTIYSVLGEMSRVMETFQEAFKSMPELGNNHFFPISSKFIIRSTIISYLLVFAICKCCCNF